MAKPKPDVITCSECGQLNCYRHDRRYPTICATVDLSPEERAELVELYGGDSRDAVISRASAEVEGRYYGEINRVEETVAFARRIGARRIGIAMPRADRGDPRSGRNSSLGRIRDQDCAVQSRLDR